MPNWNNEWSNLNTINNNNQFTNNDVPTADTFNKTINNVGWLKNALYEYTVANDEALANIRTSINGINHILTFDDTPQPLSQNLVKSGGIYSFVNSRLNASYYKMVSRAGSIAEEQTINETGLYCVEFYRQTEEPYTTVYCSATILIRNLNLNAAAKTIIINGYAENTDFFRSEDEAVVFYRASTKTIRIKEKYNNRCYISKLYKIASMP